jgi:hypothetical protein
MVNRVLEAKVFKMRRRNRKAKFSGGVTKLVGDKVSLSRQVINTGPTPNKEVLARYQESARGLAVNINWLNSRYPRQDISPDRKAALDRAHAIANEIPQMMYVSVIENHHQRCRLYFNSSKTSFLLVHEDFKHGVYRRSMTYMDKDRLLSRWYQNKVTWVESTPLVIPDSS